jgi:LEA14-like dessication related protein
MAAMLFVLCGAACSSLVQQPTAAFKSAEIRRPGADGVTVDFHVDVNNPNPVSIPISAAQYKFALGGIQVLDNSVKTTGDLPSQGTLPLTLPVTLSFENLLSAGQALRNSGGDVPYTFDGGFDLSLSGASALAGPIHVPLKFSGTLPLKQVLNDPVLLLKSPAARKLAEQIMSRR